MSLEAQILQEAERFQNLFGHLADTQWSEVALPDLKSNLTSLQHQVHLTKHNINQFNAAVDKEYKRLASIRGHGVRHIWYRVRGDLEQRLDAQEKIWLREFEKCKQEEQQLIVLEETLNSFQQQLQQCQVTHEDYMKTKQELDDLFKHFFSGATPSYPGEDAIELQLENEKDHLCTLQNHHRMFTQTLKLLRKAHTSLIQCKRSLDDALNMNTFDLFSDSSFADIAVHSNLAKARNASFEAQQYINEANRCHAGLVRIDNLNIREDNLVFNILFDNIWTDMKMRKMIREASTRISHAETALKSVLLDSERKLQQCETDQNQANSNVRRLVLEHFNTRVAIVKNIIEPPPPYVSQ